MRTKEEKIEVTSRINNLIISSIDIIVYSIVLMASIKIFEIFNISNSFITVISGCSLLVIGVILNGREKFATKIIGFFILEFVLCSFILFNSMFLDVYGVLINMLTLKFILGIVFTMISDILREELPTLILSVLFMVLADLIFILLGQNIGISGFLVSGLLNLFPVYRVFYSSSTRYTLYGTLYNAFELL